MVGWTVGAGREVRGLREVIELLDPEPLLGAELWNLAKWVAKYYVAPLGMVLRAAFPGALTRPSGAGGRARGRSLVRIRREIGTLEELEEVFGRAVRQREAYEMLVGAGGQVPLAALLEAGFSRSVIGGLQGRGAAEVAPDAIGPDPFPRALCRDGGGARADTGAAARSRPPDRGPWRHISTAWCDRIRQDARLHRARPARARARRRSDRACSRDLADSADGRTLPPGPRGDGRGAALGPLTDRARPGVAAAWHRHEARRHRGPLGRLRAAPGDRCRRSGRGARRELQAGRYPEVQCSRCGRGSRQAGGCSLPPRVGDPFARELGQRQERQVRDANAPRSGRGRVAAEGPGRGPPKRSAPSPIDWLRRAGCPGARARARGRESHSGTRAHPLTASRPGHGDAAGAWRADDPPPEPSRLLHLRPLRELRRGRRVCRLLGRNDPPPG